MYSLFEFIGVLKSQIMLSLKPESLFQKSIKNNSCFCEQRGWECEE